MKKFNRFQYSAFIICCLPIIGSIVAYFTKDYRYSEHRNIFLIGVILTYLFWGTSFMWGLVNSIFIWTFENQKILNKILWIIISLLPIIYIGTMLTTALIIDYYFNDDISLPSGERIDRF